MSETTYVNQNDLPDYPVPHLYNSVILYLESLRTFVPEMISEEAYENSRKIAKRFVKGKGSDLQERLLDRAAESRNWLSDWWLTYGYHIWRDPTPINSNYFGLLQPEFTEIGGGALSQAANMIWCMIMPRLMFDNEMIPPQYMRKGTIPLDMDCYSYLYTGTRIPGINCDRYEKKVATDDVAIYVNNQIYFFSIKHDDGSDLTQHSILRQLEWIDQDSKKNIPADDVSILGTENRTTWAEYREKLIGLDENNAELMEKISSCFVLLTIDDRTPTDMDDCGKLTATSERNKWWDKIDQFIIYKNGMIGCVGEHSPCDAPYIAWTLDYAGEQMSKGLINTTPEDRSLVTPSRYIWTVNQDIIQGIEQALINYIPLRDDLDLRTFSYFGYGKKFMKDSGFSPDSYFQMALQLAYAKMNGHGCATYETGHTRKFYHGRTDTVRTFLPPTKYFVSAMLSEGISAIEKVEKLSAAVARHKIFLRRVMAGDSFDRHLMGLRIMEMESGEPTSDFFEDPSYTLSTTFLLSTSQMPSKYYFPGFGPVSVNGYGCCYAIRDDEIVSLITSRHQCETTSSILFRDTLAESLDQISEVIIEARKAKL